jgi:hypothetical protein
MLILMTIDAMGGVFRYAIELASWLVARDVEVVFASMGRALSPAQRHELAARRIVLEESEYRLEWMDEPWHDVETEAGCSRSRRSIAQTSCISTALLTALSAFVRQSWSSRTRAYSLGGAQFSGPTRPRRSIATARR